MVVKVFISAISGNMEMKKQQEFITRILSGKKIEFEPVDISNPANEEQKNFMRAHSKVKQEGKVPLPPQVFNDDQYCGDYEDFHEANECETIFEFLKMAPPKQVMSAQVAFTDQEEKKDAEKEVEEEKEEDEEEEVNNEDEEPAENGDTGN